MKVSKGIFVDNKVRRYLLPAILIELGKVFKQKFNTEIFKLGVGLHDFLLGNTNILKGKKAFYFLVDKTFLPKEFEKFKSWIKYKEYYITDYQYDEDKHMFVIEIPKTLEYALEKFNQGKYSEMYTKKELDKFFTSKDEGYLVLTKDMRALEGFLIQVKEKFDVEVREIDFIKAEYDFPPSIDFENETFNHE